MNIGKLTTTKMEFVWENPPSSSSKYYKVVEKLIKNPNRWAVIGESNGRTNLTSELNRVARQQNPNGLIHTTIRKIESPNTTYEIYARWIPKEENE